MGAFSRFALTNFTLTALALGLLAAGPCLARRPRSAGAAAVVEELFVVVFAEMLAFKRRGI
jgi:hypothetical protein